MRSSAGSPPTTWSASRSSSPSSTGVGEEQAATCVALSQLRGGKEVLEEARSLGGAAVERATARLGETFEALEERGVAERVQVDLGLLRDLGYYSGAILEVYDPALGHVLGGGGRYDETAQRFGVDLPRPGSPFIWSASTSPRWRRKVRAGDRIVSVEVAGRRCAPRPRGR